MDYLPLGDIGNYIARFGAFEERAARPVAEQVLQGIFVIHENGYMHRDIKPEVGVQFSLLLLLNSFLTVLEHPHCLNLPNVYQAGRLWCGKRTRSWPPHPHYDERMDSPRAIKRQWRPHDGHVECRLACILFLDIT